MAVSLVKVPGLALLLVLILHGAESALNLFMNESETKRILGIPGELSYVRNGVVNDYALSFNLPIKTDGEIFFDWQNVHSSQLDPTMSYSLSVLLSNAVAMDYPYVSIPSTGIIPTKPSVFSILLRCSGQITADVDIRIQVNISVSIASNVTSLEIKRKKACIRGTVPYQVQGDISSEEDIEDHLLGNNSKLATVADELWLLNASNIFYIILGCACGAIVLLVFALVVCYCRSQKSGHDQICDMNTSYPLNRPQEKFHFRSDTPSNNSVISAGTSMCRGPTTFVYTELNPTEVCSLLAEIQVDRNLVLFTDVLLEGTFGKVFHGMVTVNLDCNTMQQEPVIVKTVTDQAQTEQINSMLRDACLLKDICHCNISPVIASCLSTEEGPPLLIYKDMGDDNLKNYLHHCRLSEMLSAHQLTYIAIQVARAMNHLHHRRILHRDVATRNCLINGQLNVRLTDSSLSRDVFPHDYHCLGDNENRPVKWMALESLKERKYSTATDMWSFGVCMWELFTFGYQPYADIDAFELVNYLQQGLRLLQPQNCPNELFTIMSCCWLTAAEERPRFSQVLSFLQDFYNALARFV